MLNFDELARSKLSNQYTFKGTFQLTRNNQVIGYLNKREKLQALRDLGPSVPVSAAYFQSSRNYPMKVEWTSVLSDRMFLDVIVGNWYNFFPLRHHRRKRRVHRHARARPRSRSAPDSRFDGGANIAYQNQLRYKPQFTASLSYAKDGWHGSHDFKFGARRPARTTELLRAAAVQSRLLRRDRRARPDAAGNRVLQHAEHRHQPDQQRQRLTSTTRGASTAS